MTPIERARVELERLFANAVRNHKARRWMYPLMVFAAEAATKERK